MDNPELRHLLDEQDRKIEEQDRSLEQLSHTVSEIKEVAINIGDELDRQQEMLTDLGEHMNHTDLRLRSTTQKIDKINNLERNFCICRLAFTIIVLVVITFLVIKYS